MKIDASTGLLTDVTYYPSPNYNQRPTHSQIDLLVIHNISLPPGQFGGTHIHDFFNNQLKVNKHPYFETIMNMKVSSHLLIQRTGQVTQFVSFYNRAWHAGQSCFEGRDNCNDFSIGIELEGTDLIPYTKEQYDSLLNVTHAIIHHFPHISLSRIVGHSDIAPDRKSDPGSSFDWAYYRKSIKLVD